MKTEHPATLKAKVLAAGLAEIADADTSHFYFQAPDGQGWRVLNTTEP